MGGFFGGIFGGESSSQRDARRKQRAEQTRIDIANQKQKKKLEGESLAALSKAQKKIRSASARRSVITEPLGITDTLA